MKIVIEFDQATGTAKVTAGDQSEMKLVKASFEMSNEIIEGDDEDGFITRACGDEVTIRLNGVRAKS